MEPSHPLAPLGHPNRASSGMLKRGQKRKSSSSSSSAQQQPAASSRVSAAKDAPNKGFVGVRWRQYPYGIRFIPRVRVPKTRYDLPLGEYRTCEEAALVRDVAAFYYGKKGAFNFKNDYLSCLPEISMELSRQEKIDWVSARAKERGRTFFSSSSKQALIGTTTSSLTAPSSSCPSLSLPQPLQLPSPVPLTLPFVSRPLVAAQPLPGGVTIATSGHHVQKPWTAAPVPLPLESFAFSCLQGRKHES